MFDDNNGKPSSLLQNSLFDIKCVDAFGDCGFLSVILPILSSKIAADNIHSSIIEYVLEKSDKKSHPLKEFFTVKGLRKLLFLVKMNYDDLPENFQMSNIEDLKDYFPGKLEPYLALIKDTQIDTKGGIDCQKNKV